MTKRFFLIIIIFSFFFNLSAWSQDLIVTDNISKKPFPVEADFRISLGALPITYDFEFPFADDYYIHSLYEQYYDAQVYKGNRYTTGSINISHSVKLIKWLELGVICSYKGNYQNVYSAIDHSIIERDYRHSFFITPTLRFAWLNKEWVRMYSSVGLGMGLLIRNEEYSHYGSNVERNFQWGPSIQLTGFGITFGKTLFGFSEVGSIGTLGIFTVGVGYRISPKKLVKKITNL